MCQSVKEGRVADFGEAYATLNERFINEIIDNESERHNEKAKMCHLCGNCLGL